MWGKRARTVIVGAATVSLLVANAAWADNIGTSDDELQTISALAFGEVCLDEATSRSVNVHASRAGSGQVYDNDGTVTVSATSVSAGVVVVGGTFTIPGDWVGSSNNRRSDRALNNVDDRPAGRASIQVTLTPTSVGSYNGSVTLQGAGPGTTRSTALGVTGTVIDCAPVDETAPVVEISLEAATPDGDNDWYRTPVTVTVTATDEDGGSGLDEDTVEYRVDGGDWTVYTAPFAVGSDGSHNVEARAHDNAGNEGTAGPVALKIDATDPTIAGSRTPPPNTHGWNNGPVAVSFNCDDETSDIASCVGDQSLSGEGEGQSVTGTATDLAGNTATDTVGGIDIDLTSPTITFTVSPAANSSEWHKDAVTVTFDCQDALSGIDLVETDCGAVTLEDDGADQSASATAVDKAGNSATLTVDEIHIDQAAPSISGEVSPAANGNGWHNADVTVTFACSPNGPSGIESCDGDTVLTEDGEGQEVTGTATSVAGKTATATITVHLDTTDPTITGSRTPLANDFGWNNTDVTVSFDCDDPLSGIDPDASACGDVTVSTEGIHSVTGTAVDVAGNTAATTVSGIRIDRTDPTITAEPDRLPNSAGWYDDDVTVTFTCDDELSGVVSCPEPVTFGEGENQSVTGTVSDEAGNSASVTVSGINVDKTPPSITGSRSPEANGFGWNNTDVIVTFTCEDTLSGLESCTPPQTVSTEGANQSVTGSAVDLAGNSAQATVGNINIDKTKPVTVVTGFTHDDVFALGGSLPVPDCESSDELSGIDDEATLLVDDSALTATGVGKVTVTCTGATDEAGNEADPAVASYWIQYAFDGFYKPIENSTLNSVKAGQSVPVKFSLDGFQGLDILPSGSATSIQRGCDDAEIPTEIEEATDTAGKSSLTYDATTDTYNYVWKTDKKWAGECRTLIVALHDGSFHTARFEFKK